MAPVNSLPGAARIPTVLFGAFDRHNFGDLLFPHVAAAMLPAREPIFAGLAARDQRPYGGHLLQGLAQLAARGAGAVDVVHVGGEVLTCDAWQAAVMLLPPAEVAATIAYLERRPAERAQWARSRLGVPASAPYCVSRRWWPGARRVIFHAVGGVDLPTCDPALRAEVLAALRSADAVSVRDGLTRSHLGAAGIVADLLPDPAALVPELFATTIHQYALAGEVTAIRAAFPTGYLAVQFSADFGDDASLQAIASGLEALALRFDLGVALFRAGAAPWHDDLGCYQRLAARLRVPVRIFGGLHLWRICALIAHSRGYLGSSLHGRILAMAFGLPRVNLRHPAQPGQATKQSAYAATWDAPEMPGAVPIDEIAPAVEQALHVDPLRLRCLAAEQARLARQGYAALDARLR